MILSDPQPMNVIAVLSMLHEPALRPNSATRRFRGEAPIAWTLHRLGRSTTISQSAVLCWEDQRPALEPIVAEMKAQCFPRSPRIAIPQLDAVAASRRWADGWRGGLLGACEFDRGFHGPWIAEIVQTLGADAVLLIDPSASVVDSALIDGLIHHAAANREIDFCFSPAAPGLSGVVVRKAMVERLAAGHSHPGVLLSYRPDLPTHDPASSLACAPIPTPLARTTHRFTLDSERQIDSISNATVHLNGQLISTEAEQLLHCMNATPSASNLPREMVLELNVRRASRPIYWPGTHRSIERPDLSLDIAKTLIDELAHADDMRLLIAGVGDPLLCDRFFEVVDYAHGAGISAIAAETDLLSIDASAIDRLAESPLDIISVHLPAASAKTYLAVMGVDGIKQAMENLRRLIDRRQSQRRGTPLVVPTFTKTAANLGEMEAWYDHWLRTLGCAAITGPGDFAGQMPDVSAAQMEPPLRRPCARLTRRLTVLCDGRVVSCEQDVHGRQTLGAVGRDSIQGIWNGMARTMRHDHAAQQWQRHSLCGTCRDWHRP